MSSTIITHFSKLDKDHNVIMLTDNVMLESALFIQQECIDIINHFTVINLDKDSYFNDIYSLKPEDLLILHIGLDSWIGKHRQLAYAFSKPSGVSSKYICIRPTITKQALLEGLNTPLESIQAILCKYSKLPLNHRIHASSKSGTDISFTLTSGKVIPYTAHKAGQNAYLPPAEISYDIALGSANGFIAADLTVGELRVNGVLHDTFGLVNKPVFLEIINGELVDICGDAIALRLKEKLWKLNRNCRKVIEFGIGLSQMSPSGIIGIDESIAGTCHFGFGTGAGNDAAIHLDFVIRDFALV